MEYRGENLYFLSHEQPRKSYGLPLAGFGHDIWRKNKNCFFFEKLFVFDEKKSVELFGITYFNENPIWFIRKKCPQKSSKIWIFWIFGGDVNRAHGRHSGSSAMTLAGGGHEIWLKKNVFKTFFSMRFFFEKIEKFQNFQKSFEKYCSSKNNVFSEIYHFSFFNRISCITSASGIAELPLWRPWAR